MENSSSKQLDLIINTVVNGFIFAFLASIISYTAFMSILNIGSEYFLQIFFSNLILWEAIAFLHMRKKYLIIFVSAVAVCALIFWMIADKEPLLEFFQAMYSFILNSHPNEDVFISEDFGAFIKWASYIALAIPLLIIYHLTRFPKAIVAFGIFCTLAFVLLSFFAPWNDYTVLFLSFLLVFALLFNFSLYKRDLCFKATTTSYPLFQAKRMSVFAVIFAIIIVCVQILPRDYYSLEFIGRVNDTADDVFDKLDYANDMYSRIFGHEDETISLGGDLNQSNDVYFSVRGNHGNLYLQTNVYDLYTGNEFEKSVSLTEENSDLLIEPITVSGEELMQMSSFLNTSVMGTYEIKFDDYNSKSFPITKYFTYIVNFDVQHYSRIIAAGLTTNFYDEIVYEDYFEKGQHFYVEYLNYNPYYYSDSETISHVIQADDIYLQLPDTISQRTYDLADELKTHLDAIIQQSKDSSLTLTQSLMYTHSFYASFVRDFLTSEYGYSTAPGPTVTEDFVDSFLFEQELGYCTSFATTMVVLLRAMDIPCRYVSGYVVYENNMQNNLDEEDWIEVSGKNKHAWVEVFVPGLGFVVYDPTPSVFNPSNNNVEIPAFAALADGDEQSDDAENPGEDSPENLADTPTPEIPERPEAVPETLLPNPLQVAVQPGENIFSALLAFLESTSQYWLVPLIAYISAILITICIICVYDYKKRLLLSMMSQKDFDTAYKSLLNLLKLVRLKQAPTETERQFFYRVFKYYHPFGFVDLKQFHKGAHATYSDFSSELSREIEDIIVMLEAQKYSSKGYKGDTDSLIKFRDKIDLHIKACVPAIVYVLRVKYIRPKKTGTTSSPETNKLTIYYF